MERRTRKATVRLTEEELARLKEAARRAGWSQEAYLRALIGGIDPRPKPPPDYLAMTRELHAIGNNLNQIARKAHALGTVDAACYRAMREASDELCREHGLSVVESPGRGGARHHAEWRAEREGRPTWRSLVKADVDEAVGRAASMRQFHANLRAMGYDVKVGKDISVRPPGKERFVRLRRNFGDAYSQEGIGARILANSRQRLPLGRPRPAPKERPPVPKGTLVSLYRRYMALLNGAKRQRAPGGRAHFLLREDLRELEAISGELALLAREGIETRSQLAAYERALADKSEALQAERRALRNEARRSKAAGSPAPPNPRIAEIASELRGARREARACARIRARSAELPARIAQIEGAEANREERQVEGHGRIERGC